MHDIFKWNYVVSCPIHLPPLWLDRKISMSYFLGQAHSHIYWQSQIILKCRGYIILFKESKIAILFPMFLSRKLSLMIYWYKNAPYLPVMLSKKIQFLRKKNNCMPKIEDCAFKKEHIENVRGWFWFWYPYQVGRVFNKTK